MSTPLRERVAALLRQKIQKQGDPKQSTEKGIIELFNDLHEAIVEQRQDDALLQLDRIVTILEVAEEVSFAVTS